MSEENKKHWDITALIIKAFYKAYNILQYGFLEKVCVNALCIELSRVNLEVKRNHAIDVYYDGKIIGSYFADIIVNDCVIIEVKAAESLCEAHEAQLTNYLRATNIEVGVLVNFGRTPQYKRKVFSARYKNLNKP